MPRAFLKKKSLLDQFKDDYGRTNPIKSARSEHQWNNPIIRHKREKGANQWIKSFQGHKHIHKLSRFNALRSESFEDDGIKCLRYANILELPNGSKIEVNSCIRCPRQFAFKMNVTGFVEDEPGKFLIYGYYPKYGPEQKPSNEIVLETDNIKDLWNYQTTGPIPGEDKIMNIHVKESHNKFSSRVLESLEPGKDYGPTEEKLGYEKGNKNSKGEDAPWVIRSHEDNRILASFAKKEDAEKHLQRMKRYSKKGESYESILVKFVGENDQSYFLDSTNHRWVTEAKLATKFKNFESIPSARTMPCTPVKSESLTLHPLFEDGTIGSFKQKEGLEKIETIRVPQWLWVALQTGDDSDLNDDEMELLADAESHYASKYLDDRGEEPYFSSVNDFDNLGGNVYDVDVYDNAPVAVKPEA